MDAPSSDAPAWSSRLRAEVTPIRRPIFGICPRRGSGASPSRPDAWQVSVPSPSAVGLRGSGAAWRWRRGVSYAAPARMHSFVVKHVVAPLFGVVEDDEKFRSAFSAAGTSLRTIEIRQDDYDHIVEAIGIDAEDDVRALHRFVRGGWREGDEGPRTTTMGTFGEVLAYLLHAGDGRKLTRVVSYGHGDAADDVSEFPTPDFLVEETGGTGCMEVKSGRALDYLGLQAVVNTANNRRRQNLAPCQRVPPKRSEAMSQLGYSDSATRPPLHDLVLKGGRAVRFPSDFGIANVLLVRDGRVQKLCAHTNAGRMKTPPACRKLARGCWACFRGDPPGDRSSAQEADVVLVDMHNESGRLDLLGSGGPERRGPWLTAYAEWSRALWTRDPVLLGPADARLSEATQAWVEGLDLRDDAGAALRGAWDRYLGTVASAHGLHEIAIRERFVGRPVQRGFDRERARTGPEPSVERVAALNRAVLEGGGARRVRATIGATAISLLANEDQVEFRAVSTARGPTLIDGVVARRLAQQLVKVALKAFQGVEDAAVDLTDGFVPVVVRAGDAELQLGWRYQGGAGYDPFPWSVVRPWFATKWILGLWLGDPRVALGVHADGRAYLRFPRKLSDPHVIHWLP